MGVSPERLPVISSAPIRNPYKGLRAFQEVDAADFFGRAALVDELLEAVNNHRLVAVVGSSGSGKSSAVRAGLLPAIRAGGIPGSRGWLTTSMYPGSYPFEELEAALLRVAVEHPSSLIEDLRSDERGLLRVVKQVLPTDDSELLLVIDQFEEVFSMVESEETRLAFLSSLATVAGDERGRVRIVLTLRADFFHRPLDYPGFSDLLREGLVPVTPPSEEGLALAISRPVRAVGLDLEPGLVGEIIKDVQGEPGSLPLMQYALTELFHRREGNVLTVAGYRASGGVLGALGRRAEELFEGLSPSGQEAAKQLFLRLVTVDEETDDTRRRVRQGELRSLEVEQNVLDDVIQQFASYRLLSFDQDPVTRSPTVEVAHEALLREWPRLRGWIEDQRDGLILHRRLVAALAEWKESDGNAGFLLSGGRLQQYESWSKTSSLSLTAHERDYLSESRTDEDRRLRRHTIRRWSIVGVLAAATFVIGLLALSATDQGRLATVRELAAASVAKVEADPELAILLALQAAETSRSAGEAVVPEALDALHRAVQASRIVGRIDGNWFVEFSPNGEQMVVGSGQDAAIWDVATEEMVRVLSSPGGEAEGAAFSPDGLTLAVGYFGDEGSLALWDVATGKRLFVLVGPTGGAVEIAFSPDGSLVAASGDAGPVFVWNVADGSERYQVGPDASDPSFSPDGSLFAVVAWDRSLVTLHDPDNGEETGVVEIPDFSPQGIAFDPSGQRLAVVEASGNGARIVDLATRGVSVSITSPRPVGHAWSPDGRWLALVGNAGNPTLYDTTTGDVAMVLPGPASFSLAFSPDGRRLASASHFQVTDGDTLVWDVTPAGSFEVATFHLPADVPPRAALFANGSDEILVASHNFGGSGPPMDVGPASVALIDGSGGQIAMRPDAFVHWPFALSSTAGLLGITDTRCSGYIIDTRTLETVYELPAGMFALAMSTDGSRFLLDLISPPEFEPANPCESEFEQPIVVDYSSDFEGERLVAMMPERALGPAEISDDGTLAVVSPYDTEEPFLFNIGTEEVMSTFVLGSYVFAFSPDGDRLAVATASGQLKTFDVDALRAGAESEDALVWSVGAYVERNVGVEYTPDGSAILTLGRSEGTVRVWDADTGERITELLPYRGGTSPNFSIHPDGRRVTALGADDTVRVYTLDNDELIAIAKDRVTRSFTEDECRAYLHVEECPADS